jgi:hypothetical protein
LRAIIFYENHYYAFLQICSSQTKVEYNNIYKNYYPFNRFIKVNRTNVLWILSLLILLSPNRILLQLQIPMLKRGKGKLDIGLLAHEVIEEKTEKTLKLVC